jgi:hypothetical protein
MPVPLDRTEVTPIPKQTREWHCPKGLVSCTRIQPCVSCRGRRNRRAGKAKQRAARKLLGVPETRYAGQSADEENWRDERLRWECKAGKQVQSLAARFLDAERQSDANKAVGDMRPFAFVAMPTGWGNEGIVAVRLSVWSQLWA